MKFTQFVVKIGKNKTKLFAKSEHSAVRFLDLDLSDATISGSAGTNLKIKGAEASLAKAGAGVLTDTFDVPVPQGDPDGDDDDQGVDRLSPPTSAFQTGRLRLPRLRSGRRNLPRSALFIRTRAAEILCQGHKGVSQRRRRWDADAVPRPDGGPAAAGGFPPLTRRLSP